MGLDSLFWIPGFGFLGLDSWVWIPGFGFLGLDSWLWSPEIGVLGLDSLILTPGQNLNENPIKTLSFLTEFANPVVPPTIELSTAGELGPETRFKKESLHKLARALLRLTYATN